MVVKKINMNLIVWILFLFQTKIKKHSHSDDVSYPPVNEEYLNLHSLMDWSWWCWAGQVRWFISPYNSMY